MKSPFECRQFAEQCRAMAKGLSGERRREVLNMADIWEALARDGEKSGEGQVVADAGLERQKVSGLQTDRDSPGPVDGHGSCLVPAFGR